LGSTPRALALQPQPSPRVVEPGPLLLYVAGRGTGLFVALAALWATRGNYLPRTTPQHSRPAGFPLTGEFYADIFKAEP